MSRQRLTGPLVALLADGAWHPGPELAQQLGVTRARISQHVRALREIGLDVFAVNGKGYRLPEPLTLLDADAIRATLSAQSKSMLDTLDVLAETDSTNAWLMGMDSAGTRACFAEYQAAGRGRRDRPWSSPFGSNLYFSVSHMLLSSRAPLGTLSLAIGVALAERLQTLGAAGVGVKWPNDLYVDQAKLAGILIEHRGEAGGQSRVVVGTGLNVSMNPAQAPDISQSWQRLVDHVPALPDRNALAGHMLDAVLAALSTFQHDGFEPFHKQWPALDVVCDRKVTIDYGRYKRSGKACGIAADGALRVEFEDGIEPVYAGEVSLRVTR